MNNKSPGIKINRPAGKLARDAVYAMISHYCNRDEEHRVGHLSRRLRCKIWCGRNQGIRTVPRPTRARRFREVFAEARTSALNQSVPQLRTNTTKVGPEITSFSATKLEIKRTRSRLRGEFPSKRQLYHLQSCVRLGPATTILPFDAVGTIIFVLRLLFTACNDTLARSGSSLVLLFRNRDSDVLTLLYVVVRTRLWLCRANCCQPS